MNFANPGSFVRHGEVFVTLATAAQCYHVEVRWVEDVYASGLLGEGERVDGSIAITASDLDRLAMVLRWHRHYGLDLDSVAALIDW